MPAEHRPVAGSAVPPQGVLRHDGVSASHGRRHGPGVREAEGVPARPLVDGGGVPDRPGGVLFMVRPGRLAGTEQCRGAAGALGPRTPFPPRARSWRRGTTRRQGRGAQPPVQLGDDGQRVGAGAPGTADDPVVRLRAGVGVVAAGEPDRISGWATSYARIRRIMAGYSWLCGSRWAFWNSSDMIRAGSPRPVSRRWSRRAPVLQPASGAKERKPFRSTGYRSERCRKVPKSREPWAASPTPTITVSSAAFPKGRRPSRGTEGSVVCRGGRTAVQRAGSGSAAAVESPSDVPGPPPPGGRGRFGGGGRPHERRGAMPLVTRPERAGSGSRLSMSSRASPARTAMRGLRRSDRRARRWPCWCAARCRSRWLWPAGCRRAPRRWRCRPGGWC